MKTSFMILIFISLLSIAEIKFIAYADTAIVDNEYVWRTDEEIMAIYKKWMLEHDKSYNGLGDEILKRFEIFKDNLKYIEEHNTLPNQTYKLGLNQFSDLTLDEFKSVYLTSTHIDTLNESESDFSYLPELNNNLALPDSVDWRKKCVLVPIKNQGPCGSSWAFSAVASVEALSIMRGGDFFSLSEQMLVDCVTSSHGCKGGHQTDAFRYIMAHGIASSDNYPYKGVERPCQNKTIELKIWNFGRMVNRTEDNLKGATSNRVMSASMKAGSRDFQLYKSGIFSGKCGDELDHGVNVVVCGSENGKDYWIVRNSWGRSWGENGYIRLIRNVQNDGGYCGIALDVTFVALIIPVNEGNISIL